MNLDRNVKHIIAVGGGKGGVGKSIFSISLAASLAEMGKDVVLADFDLGGANLHTYLGVNSKKSIADFFQKKVGSLEEILEDTGIENLRLISGSEFVPGIANPAYWMKMKMIRHLKALRADILIIDLGAGVHYNVLDLFGLAESGIVVTTPEPGAVINAYSFIKAALFRKLQVVFQNHQQIGPVIKGLMEKSGDEGAFRLEWIREQINDADKEMAPIVNEICDSFHPFLVVNNVADNDFQYLIDNLTDVCDKNMGVALRQLGVIRRAREITRYLTDIPAFLASRSGSYFNYSIKGIAKELLANLQKIYQTNGAHEKRSDFDDESITRISSLIDNADRRILNDSDKKLWKLRLFFNPVEVVNYLISKGLDNDLFYRDEMTPGPDSDKPADINSFTCKSDRKGKRGYELQKKEDLTKNIVRKF